MGEPQIAPVLAYLIDTGIGERSEPLARVLELVAFSEPLDADLLATMVDRNAVVEAEARRHIIGTPCAHPHRRDL